MDDRLFDYNGKLYPDYIRRGRAADFIIPAASMFCVGDGLDIGGTKECSFLGAKPINILFNDGFHATNLPPGKYDYIFSSHCLEHIENYLETLLYWRGHLKDGGVLFLYLPHPDMEYWHPRNCKKHRHMWAPDVMILALKSLGFQDIICTGRDLYWSYAVVAFNRIEKK